MLFRSVSAKRPAKGTCVHGQLGDIAFQGDSSIVEIILPDGGAITALASEAKAEKLMKLEMGSEICAYWQPEDMLLLPAGAT